LLELLESKIVIKYNFLYLLPGKIVCFHHFFNSSQNPIGVFLNENWLGYYEVWKRVVKMSDENKKDKWKKGKWPIFFIGLIDIILLLFGILIKDFRAFSIGFIGIFTFFGILMLTKYLSASEDLENGEMRKAITGSFIVVYFAFLSLFTFEEFGISYTGVFKTMIDHFTYLVGIIVVFYFGSRSVEEYMKNKKGIETENAKVQQELLKVELEKLQQSKGKK